MPGIFVSYRREDSPGHAGRIFDRLRSRFGSDVVFMDVAAIEAGVDFVDVLHKAVGSCDALLAVIGPQWLKAGFRFLIRLSGERSKTPGIVETQVHDEAAVPDQPRRVVLTAAPISTVIVHVVKGDERKADALVAYLKEEPSTTGSIVRGMAVVPRAEGGGRVAYSEDQLAAQAEAIAKDTSAYLARTGNRRTLQANLNPRVARGAIIVNLYERAP